MKRFARATLRMMAGVFALCIVAGLTGCSFLEGIVSGTPSVEEALAARASSRSAQISTPVIQEDGYLTVGLNSSQTAPFYIENSDGSVSGLDVDMAAIIANELGLELRFVVLDSPEDEEAENCDIVMGVTTDTSGDLTVVGSYAERGVVFFQKGDDSLVSATELTGLTVGLQSGSASEQALNETDIVVTQRQYSNLNDAFDALNSGSVDYVLCEAYAGGYLATQYSNITMASCLGNLASVGVGVSGDATELQSAIQRVLDTLTSNGLLDLTRSCWVGDMEPITSDDLLADVGEAEELSLADTIVDDDEETTDTE